MFTEWAGGIASFCGFIVHLAAVVSLLMALGSIVYREVPVPSDMISMWLRMRCYTVPAVFFAAVLRFIPHPNHLWLFVGVSTFLLTTLVVTPLVERHNTGRDREV